MSIKITDVLTGKVYESEESLKADFARAWVAGDISDD